MESGIAIASALARPFRRCRQPISQAFQSAKDSMGFLEWIIPS
jgi:hypothetical protein